MPEGATSRWVEDEPSTVQLIAQCRSGDRQAFSVLYERHVMPLRRYARRLASHEYAAEDLVAEAFARTWEQLCAGRGPDLAFMGYLRAVVLRLHLDHLRLQRSLIWVPDVEGAALADPDLTARIIEQTPEHLVLERLFNEHMKRALATLPQRWQSVLVLVYVENQPYAEVAAQLGLSVAGTRQLARRARLGMRQALTALAEEPSSARRGA
ncbi:RNA polymerase sigma factor (sigma-70 family) [Phycicoccus badiiscoriae]|uniref:RNA polymerase sigma factor (Sigma-70 family) n=1 Tax=Pedococcus badiiscoriae TaxID=642776 RepID=A0A852WI40_9MICO|nr:RNA polymerase sigma factor [Pedococcus badiiscoriae]NYG08638.1 RNA polymerase sigma factor (sigma-70 family) [Pedococcus badiiscoriae]